MDVGREMLQAVAELWTCYLKQKITATDAETMLWLAGDIIVPAEPGPLDDEVKEMASA